MKKMYVELGNNRYIEISFINNIARYKVKYHPIALEKFIKECYNNDLFQINKKLIINLNKKKPLTNKS